MDADSVLATVNARSRCTAQQWEAIARLALQRFATFLGMVISHDRLGEEDFEDGFSITICGCDPVRDHLRLTWRGILGASVGGEVPEISAIVFLYSDGKRLMAKSGEDYLSYRYGQDSAGRYCWTATGWEIDEHDEYGFFDQDFLDISGIEVTSPSIMT